MKGLFRKWAGGGQKFEPPAELVAEAARQPGGWVYEIDADMTADPNGEVPPEAIMGAWKVDDHGRLTGEYEANPKYSGSGGRGEQTPRG
ncbi:hypothetical protein ACFV1W_26585 [Kitasatospora sp. NPDC059648]|uniref:hypothetical protein n=1 Tax=Kitasatospora sp. NPDC059648 TaxID=3346894 RepID=UPI00369F891F